jgi:hypothetical protein
MVYVVFTPLGLYFLWGLAMSADEWKVGDRVACSICANSCLIGEVVSEAGVWETRSVLIRSYEAGNCIMLSGPQESLERLGWRRVVPDVSSSQDQQIYDS